MTQKQLTQKEDRKLQAKHNTKEVTTFLAKDRLESPTHSGFPRFWAQKKFINILMKDQVETCQ